MADLLNGRFNQSTNLMKSTDLMNLSDLHSKSMIFHEDQFTQ